MTRKLFLSLAVIIAFGAAINFLVKLYDTEKTNEILAQRDTRLASFSYAKGVASSYLELLDINDQAEYESLKAKYGKIMSTELWDDYFSNNTFQPAEKSFYYKVDSTVGEILGDNDFVFKVDFTLTGANITKQSSLLIFIKNGIVYKTQSLT